MNIENNFKPTPPQVAHANQLDQNVHHSAVINYVSNCLHYTTAMTRCQHVFHNLLEIKQKYQIKR